MYRYKIKEVSGWREDINSAIKVMQEHRALPLDHDKDSIKQCEEMGLFEAMDVLTYGREDLEYKRAEAIVSDESTEEIDELIDLTREAAWLWPTALLHSIEYDAMFMNWGETNRVVVQDCQRLTLPKEVEKENPFYFKQVDVIISNDDEPELTFRRETLNKAEGAIIKDIKDDAERAVAVNKLLAKREQR